MALALWLVCGWVLLVCFGTWALQLALGLVQLGLRLAVIAACVTFGMISVLALAVFDRPALRRILRRHAADRAVATTLARERWS